MHVLRSMDRKELAITIFVFLAITILWICGFCLIVSSARSYQEIESPSANAVPSTSSPPVVTPSPDHIAMTTLQNQPTTHTSSESSVFIYFIAITVLTSVAVRFWRRRIYLPVKSSIYVLSAIEAAESYDFSPHPW